MNKFLPHVLVLPEDDANRQVLNGFELDPEIDPRRIQVLPAAGGWTHVVESFLTDHVSDMRRWQERRMVLVIDCDDDLTRVAAVRERIPKDVGGRVLILGARMTPEVLRGSVGKSYEVIGRELARECAERKNDVWSDPQLVHNEAELGQLADDLRGVLFPSR